MSHPNSPLFRRLAGSFDYGAHIKRTQDRAKAALTSPSVPQMPIAGTQAPPPADPKPDPFALFDAANAVPKDAYGNPMTPDWHAKRQAELASIDRQGAEQESRGRAQMGAARGQEQAIHQAVVERNKPAQPAHPAPPAAPPPAASLPRGLASPPSLMTPSVMASPRPPATPAALSAPAKDPMREAIEQQARRQSEAEARRRFRSEAWARGFADQQAARRAQFEAGTQALAAESRRHTEASVKEEIRKRILQRSSYGSFGAPNGLAESQWLKDRVEIEFQESGGDLNRHAGMYR